MPAESNFDEAKRRLLVVAEGRVGLGEILAYIARLDGDPRLGQDLDFIIDLTNLANIPTPEMVRSTVQEIGQLSLRFRHIAGVVSNDETYGMSRMFGMLVGKLVDDARIFRTRKQANAWLDEAMNPV